MGMTDRAVARDLVRRVPALLPEALLRSHRDGAGAQSHPAQLRRLERTGYLYGPLAYLRSRSRFRSVMRRPRRGAIPADGPFAET
jgi:hypothetical protein